MKKNRSRGKKHLVQPEGPQLEDSPSEMLEQGKLKYLMVNMIAQRARNLNRGDRAAVEYEPVHTLTDLALAEVKNEKMKVIHKPPSKVLVSLIETE